MPTIQELVGARVREVRKVRGWTLEELAEKADKHYTYHRRLEHGDRNVTVEVLHAVAGALQVPLKSLFDLQPHPLEVKLNAASDNILSAIEKGFRAIINAKGKLAEYFLNRELKELQRRASSANWSGMTRTASRDFHIQVPRKTAAAGVQKRPLARREAQKRPVPRGVQRTRNSKDGTPTRTYRADHFELLSVCLSTARERGRICTSPLITLSAVQNPRTCWRLCRPFPRSSHTAIGESRWLTHC